jgi:diacylglycerol kinase (ATP)
MKLAVLSNPGSGRNRRSAGVVDRALASGPEILRLSTEDGPVAAILEEIARAQVGLLLIDGGDGTVQRVLTALLEERPFERPPLLAILPRGTANTTAQNVGLRGRGVGALRRLFRVLESGRLEDHVRTCRVLRVENIVNAPPQRAMFFGAAGVCDAIDFCDREVYARGLIGNLGIGLATARLVLGGRAGQVLKGHEVGISCDGRPEQRSRLLLLLATTLERMILNSRPFWNDHGKAIRITSVADPPVQLLRSTVKVLFGWRRGTLPEGVYASGGTDRLAIDLGSDRRFTLDGEWFEAAVDRPLLLTAADQLRFVRV